jgi:hypothetical protein
MKTFLTLSALLILNSFNLFVQWESDVRLSDFPISSRINDRVGKNIASNGNIVHAVWDDARHGTEREIYYKRSTDDGISWGVDTRLTNDPAISELSTVAVSGNVVYVMWYDNRDGNGEIYFKRSTDAGLTWGDEIRLTDNSGLSNHPSVAVSGQIVHVVWQDTRDGANGEIYYKRSTDEGVNWGTDMRLTNNSAASWNPSVSLSGSVVHVVWRDKRDGANGEIYYKRSADGGVSWENDIRLTNDPSASTNCSVNVSGQVVHILWRDNRDGNDEIYYKHSTDGGASWGTDIRLTNNSDVSINPSVTSSGSIVHVVWEDYRDGSEIYYKLSTDGGLNWNEDTRLTNAGSFSMYPSVSVSDSVVHVLWEDFRDGAGAEIYYKRNPTGNPTGVENIRTEFPKEFSLAQNYPNPFNPSTKINWQSPVSSWQTLKVYDVLGNVIATLVDEYKPAGNYEVRFIVANLPSGVYFYKLQTGSFVETKKMLFLK